jgi:hypothetical protein
VIAPNLPAEGPLLFRATARRPGAGIRREPATAGTRPIDWSRVADLAVRENAAAVLWGAIESARELDIPAPVRTRIRGLALAWTLKLRLLERRLHESIDALVDAGIDVMLLKGAALAVSAYPSFVHRPMADLDLLVNADRVSDAHRLMQATGWVVESSAHPAEAWNGHHHLPPLADTRGSGLRLEIHAAPLAPGHSFRMDQQSLRSTAKSVRVGRARVSVPEPHVHVVHSAIHFAWAHAFESGALNAFRDIAILSTADGFSWERLERVARETRSETSVYWTLRLARRLAGLVVPSSVLDRLAPPLGERTLSVLEHHFAHIICRTAYACPSVALRRRLWATALGSHVEPYEFNRGDRGVHGRVAFAAVLVGRRLASQLCRLPVWSYYCLGLLRAAVEVSA